MIMGSTTAGLEIVSIYDISGARRAFLGCRKTLSESYIIQQRLKPVRMTLSHVMFDYQRNRLVAVNGLNPLC